MVSRGREVKEGSLCVYTEDVNVSADAELPADTATKTPEFFLENIRGWAFRLQSQQCLLLALVEEWQHRQGTSPQKPKTAPGTAPGMARRRGSSIY